LALEGADANFDLRILGELCPKGSADARATDADITARYLLTPGQSVFAPPRI